MDKHEPPAYDVNAMERRLAACQPSTTGLDRDRLLFAAGRDSVRRGYERIAWPVISAALAIVATMLVLGQGRDREPRMSLGAGLGQLPLGAHSRRLVGGDDTATRQQPEPDSYLALSRLLAEDVDRWPVLAKADSSTSPVPQRPILKANSSAEALER